MSKVKISKTIQEIKTVKTKDGTVVEFKKINDQLVTFAIYSSERPSFGYYKHYDATRSFTVEDPEEGYAKTPMDISENVIQIRDALNELIKTIYD